MSPRCAAVAFATAGVGAMAAGSRLPRATPPQQLRQLGDIRPICLSTASVTALENHQACLLDEGRDRLEKYGRPGSETPSIPNLRTSEVVRSLLRCCAWLVFANNP
jgi:hypothetical protein